MEYKPDFDLIRGYFNNREWVDIFYAAGSGVQFELDWMGDIEQWKGSLHPSVSFLQEKKPILAKLLSKYEIPVSQLDNFCYMGLICYEVFERDNHADCHDENDVSDVDRYGESIDEVHVWRNPDDLESVKGPGEKKAESSAQHRTKGSDG